MNTVPLFIHLFSYLTTATNPQYLTTSGWVIRNQWAAKDGNEIGSFLIGCTVPVFARRQKRKPQNLQPRWLVSRPTDAAGYLMNASQKRHSLQSNFPVLRIVYVQGLNPDSHLSDHFTIYVIITTRVNVIGRKIYTFPCLLYLRLIWPGT